MGSSVILPVAGQPVEGPDPNFVSASQPSAVQFITRDLPPPAPLYLTRDDAFNLVVYSSFAGAVINLNGRILLPAGTTLGQPGQPGHMPEAGKVISTPLITPFSSNFAPTSNRLRNVFLLPLYECFLLGAQLFVADSQFAGGGEKRGQLFAYFQLARGNPTFSVGSQTLFADYLQGGIAKGWPGGRIIDPTDGPGFVHSVQQANPAAGADWTFVVPTGARFRVDSFNAQLLTSAAAANRNVQVIVDDGANIVWSASLAASIVAGTTQQISGTGTNSPTGVIPTVSSLVIPPGLILFTGWRIRTVTGNIQAGDQWSNIWFNLEEWIEP